ncbi:hypothetical protein QR665_06355 [Acinetobacter gerneri]|uniref:J517_1871 family lipoprotein n=1 Tax=Acinetobacter gerneri TaxID=202952 RepID=UPI00293550BC|nr:J517_1871 family lipoprotein [Acinetobacter gerneri]MDV2439105.1 hypothetical protein [Acinetobacter gerneri]
MKCQQTLVLSLFSLSGCVSINAQKISDPSETNTRGLIGVWTSKLVVSESSFQINPDNSGKYCMSILNSNSVNSFKIEDDVITLNEGSKFKIINSDQNKIIIRPLRTKKENEDLKYVPENYFDTQYVKDDNLSLTSEYCKKAFTK